MSDIVIFGGTTEGRRIAEYCQSRKMNTVVCVVSEYGEELLPKSNNVKVIQGALSKGDILTLLQKENPTYVVDATHPYAKNITTTLLEITTEYKFPYTRVLRQSVENSKSNQCVYVETTEDAISFLNGKEGNILLTTGSKEIASYTKIENYEERIFARVLPQGEVLQQCEQLGFKGKHLIGMQGPFTKELNRGMINQLQIQWLVTKESGSAGGYLEKIQAADECGISTVVIGRPLRENGMSLESFINIIRNEYVATDKCASLIGMGMGQGIHMTKEAFHDLNTCEVVFGAPRMLEDMKEYLNGIETYPIYKGEEIAKWLMEHPGYQQIAILFSGDTGFFSGSANAKTSLESIGYSVRVLPGISTVAALSAKFGISWEETHLATMHGRTLDVIHTLKENKRVFLLLGGEYDLNYLYQQLKNSGYKNVKLRVGERIGYQDERIASGTIEELKDWQQHSLIAAIIERD